MKTRTIFTIMILLLACTMPWRMSAKSYDASQLPIVVRNMPEWSNEYPTVINNWDGRLVNSINGELPPLLSVVTSVNGKDTKGMSEADFNNLLMSQGKSTIVYLVKKQGANVKHQCTISYYPSIYWAEGVSMSEPEPLPENIAMKNIKNASVFSLNTFAFKTGQVGEIDEERTLEAVAKSLARLGFRKADKADQADMVLELTKDRDNYNGYRITLSILDGRKLRSGVERALWTLQVSDLTSDLKRQESAIKTALNKQCNNFPFDIPVYSESFYTLGVAFESEEAVRTGQTIKILKGSDAYDKGLRSGDAIIGAYAGFSSDLYYTQTRRYYFKPNKQDRQKNWGVDFFLILPIVPQFTYNNAYHYLSDNTWRGGTESKNHFKVRNSYGRKFRVSAPFTSRRFNLKYIH